MIFLINGSIPMDIVYYGHSCLLVEHQGVRVIIDPFLSGNPASGIAVSEGDTALFSDMKLIGERYSIDAAALPIGDNYTMGPEDAATAARWIGAPRVIPIHYNTFPVIRQDPDLFRKRIEALGMTCHPLKSGERVTL